MVSDNFSLFPILTLVCWIGLFGFWVIAAYYQNKDNARKQNELNGFLKLAGIPLVMYAPWIGWGWIGTQVLPNALVTELLGALLCASGVCLAVWARVALRGNWSGNIAIKENHQLIQRGPYRLVRHPIYTGGILALFGSATALGGLWGFVVAISSCFGLYLKAKREEDLLSQQFPNEYEDYKKQVKSLIPFIF